MGCLPEVRSGSRSQSGSDFLGQGLGECAGEVVEPSALVEEDDAAAVGCGRDAGLEIGR